MKTRFILISLVTLFTVTMLIFQACKKDAKNLDDNDIKPVPETTKIIDESTWQTNVISIDSSNYTFTFNENLANKVTLKAGDILVSSVGEGYLRKVSNVVQENGEIKIYTEFASLNEAVRDGSFTFSTVLSEQNIKKITYLKKGIKIDTTHMKSTEATNIEATIDEYFDADHKVHVTGNFSMLPIAHCELELGVFKVKKFSINYEIEEQINLATTLEILNVAYSKEVELVNITFNTIIVYIGSVPVVIVPEMVIIVGANLNIESNISTSIHQQMNYSVGVLYENGIWAPTQEQTNSFTYQPPTLSANANAKVYIKPQLSFKVYGFVSPYIYGEAYGRLEADLLENPWWNLYGGANVGLGVRMKIIKQELMDWPDTPYYIFEYEQLIASASISDPPIAEFYSNTTSGSAPLTVNFIDQSTNNPTSWQWDFGDGGTSTQASPSHIYSTEGSYAVALTVTNNYGADTESKTNYITVSSGGSNTPPTALFTVTPSSGTTSTNFAFDASGSTDNEDPTSDLQVRWDFDGNGSWDTNWDTDKTQSHQYSSEATYTAKLEVKDTEGLTDQYTKGITVSNGGGTGSFTDLRDGQTYSTIVIGNQTWFAENLNYTTSNSWTYDDDPANGDVYGRLYTWDAALTACPSGWHLPSDAEWDILKDILGGYYVAGGKLKEAGTAHWNSPNTGATNSSGFTALPGGIRLQDGAFIIHGESGYWWSSTEYIISGNNALIRTLGYGTEWMTTSNDRKTRGFSIRCLKD